VSTTSCVPGVPLHDVDYAVDCMAERTVSKDSAVESLWRKLEPISLPGRLSDIQIPKVTASVQLILPRVRAGEG